MKTLWTPWRMSYILGEEGRSESCLFDFPAQVKEDKKALLLYKDNLAEVLLNRFPYANGHLLVAPTRHVADLVDLSTAESGHLIEIVRQSTVILRKHYSPDGFNIGLNIGAAAGAGQADHLHFHVVPRWQEDHNFMTVLSEVRTIPQHIENTYDSLVPDFQVLHSDNT